MNDEARNLDEGIQRQIENIVRENWTVDGPFLTSVDEVAATVRAKFGMPAEFLKLLTMSIVIGSLDIFKRKDDAEMARLMVRMYLCGLLAGADWQEESALRKRQRDGDRT